MPRSLRLRPAVAALVAAVAVGALHVPEAEARPGGWGGVGGGGWGGRHGGGRGTKKTPKTPPTAGAKPDRKLPPSGGVADMVAFLDDAQRDEAEAALPDLLTGARFASGLESAAEDRLAALAAARESASRARRSASESGSHPL